MGKFKRKFRIQPQERYILWELEEAGEDSLTGLLNALHCDEFPDIGGEPFLRTAEVALKTLLRGGLIQLARTEVGPPPSSVPYSREESLQLLNLTSNLSWVDSALVWTWSDAAPVVALPYVILTDDGREFLAR